MKKIILLLAAFFCITNNYAQTMYYSPKFRDSLKILLQKEKQDTSRVMLLARLSSAYIDIKPDTSMLLALEALSLSKRIGFVRGEAPILNQIGTSYRTVGNYPKAMRAYLQALKLNEIMNNVRGIANSNSLIGRIYFDQEEYHQAIDYYLKAKKLAEINNDKRFPHPSNLLNLGLSYLGLKQYDSARVYAQQSYELSSKVNNRRAIGNALSAMGEIYSATGQNKLALEYYRLSIPYAKQYENYRNLSGIFLGMAKLFEKEGEIDSTLFYANQAYEISRGKGFTKVILDASSFLYSFYNTRGNSDRALFYLQLATVAKDSLYSQQKISQLHSLNFDEKLRQQEIATAELKAKGERYINLQFAAIAAALITFIVLFFALSRSIIVKTKFIEFFGVLGLLAVFEFINLFIHPYLAHATNDSPVLMLGVLIAIGALLIPFHHKLEKWITKIMVEKNKKIRLEAARKTIANLEPAFAEATAGKTDQNQ